MRTLIIRNSDKSFFVELKTDILQSVSEMLIDGFDVRFTNMYFLGYGYDEKKVVDIKEIENSFITFKQKIEAVDTLDLYVYDENQIEIKLSGGLGPGYDIFILGGQSNGYSGPTTDASDVYPTGVLQLGNALSDIGDIIPATEPLDQSLGIRSTNSSGPMRTFIDNYLANEEVAEGRNILIIAGCLSGTGFFDDRWNKGDDLYEELVSRVNLVKALPGNHVIKGIFMQMGERDSQGTDDEWEENSINFTVNFKNDIGINYSNTPVVFGGMLPSWADDTAARIAVNNRMKIINTYIEYSEFASADLPTEITTHVGDGLHYDIVAQRELGNRYWTAYQSAISNNFTRAVSDAVNDLAVTPKASYNMQLDWTKPANAYPYIDSYNVYYKLPASGTYTLFENTTSLQSTITGLSATTEYDFMVRAVNFIGESANSNVITDTTELNPISYTHEFRYEFENDLDNGIGGTGTGFGTVAYASDGGGEFAYDGGGAAINGVDTGFSIPANTDWSKSCWINATSNTIQHIMSSGDATGSAMAFQSSKMRIGTIANVYAISQSDTMPAGWNHIVVTYNHTTDLCTLYVNGVSKGSATIADFGAHNIYIGNKNGQSQGFYGLIDDVRVFLKVVSGAEITQLGNRDEI